MLQTWFECKVKYVKVDKDGRERQVTENFLLDAVSFTDAEARITAQMQTMVRAEFTVTDIKKSKVAEVFPFEAGEWWYRATINLSTIDEEAGKEKKLRTTYLVQADDIQEALTRLDESLSFLIVPYVTSAIAVSTIADVFPYVPGQVIPSVEIPFRTPGISPSNEKPVFMGVVTGTKGSSNPEYTENDQIEPFYGAEYEAEQDDSDLEDASDDNNEQVDADQE